MNNKDKDNNSIDIPKFINYEDLEGKDTFMKDVNSSLSKQINSYYEDDKSSNREQPRKKKKTPKLAKTMMIMFVFIVLIGGLLLFTGIGKKLIINIAGNYIYTNLKYQPSNTTQPSGGDNMVNSDPKDKAPNYIVNILLIGVEEFKGAKNTDSMMIATMNTKDHTLKLTSLMRDLYVQIPGYNDNRLNSAYPKGGIELLYETINLNFGIPIDGYCLVNFDAFQKIIDLIGGVEITLTSDEADYLKTTNYISEKANRNVVAGTQLMNGNQALGYSRIRKVSTATEHDDYGRTQRQRIVLEAIYDKIRTKNIISQVLLLNDILTQVKIETDIQKTDFNLYLQDAVELNVKDIVTFRIPTDGSFDNASVTIGSRKASVLIPKDWDATRDEIHTFIYDDTSDTGKAQ